MSCDIHSHHQLLIAVSQPSTPNGRNDIHVLNVTSLAELTVVKDPTKESEAPLPSLDTSKVLHLASFCLCSTLLFPVWGCFSLVNRKTQDLRSELRSDALPVITIAHYGIRTRGSLYYSVAGGLHGFNSSLLPEHITCLKPSLVQKRRKHTYLSMMSIIGMLFDYSCPEE